MDGLKQDTALIRELARFADTTVAGIARKADIAPSTLQRPANGSATTRLSQRTLEKLQDAFPDFPQWTSSSGVQDRRLGYNAQPSSQSGDGMMSIQMLDFAYGMGGSYLDDALQEGTTEQFPRAFLRNYTRAPADQLYFAKGIGDSMMPTIHDSDLVLIDRSQDTPRMNDQVWAIARGDIGMIKRLRFTGENASTAVIMSDNADVSDDTAGEDELSIIGRVVAVIRRI